MIFKIMNIQSNTRWNKYFYKTIKIQHIIDTIYCEYFPNIFHMLLVAH
jgi:hypothetical protein